MNTSLRAILAATIAILALTTAALAADNVPQSTAGTYAQLKTLLGDPAVKAIRLTADIKLDEPLTVARGIRIDGARADEPNCTISGDIAVEAADVVLANVQLDGSLTLSNVRRIDLQNVRSNRVVRGVITFTFDGFYQIGFFANGDYWVRGPVVLQSMTPEFDGNANGWEVNPVFRGGHGFRSGNGFDASLVPDLPYKAEGRLSIVKTTRATGAGHSTIQSAVVLTVVDDVPPENGAAVFRPPYVGDEKPYYFVRDLKTDLLPSYAKVEHMPTLASVENSFSSLRMDHKPGVIGRSLRPRDSMMDYQPKNTPAQNNGILRLMMDDDPADKMPALIQMVQFGIDKIHTMYIGQTWGDGGGHQPGHRLVTTFAAVMLDIQKAKEMLRDATFFHGMRYFIRDRHENGLVLWGNSGPGAAAYWNYIANKRGNRSMADPYRYVDGGRISEGAYQVITAQAHKGEILAAHLMPVLQESWNKVEFDMMQNYTDRWVLHGQWAQPDPHAPFDGDADNLGKTFGPDPQRPGHAIAGEGRFPASHGKHRDAGQYRTPYVAAMWDAYRASTELSRQTPPFAAVITPLEGTQVQGTIQLEATAFGIHGVESVQFRINGEPLAAPVTEPPYRVSWPSAQTANGACTITAVATDRRKNTFESAPTIVQVANDN